jgi:hypothetical protein
LRASSIGLELMGIPTCFFPLLLSPLGIYYLL